MKARDAIGAVVKNALAPMFKRHGFRKDGLHFTRRAGSVAHYFNVQLSQWNGGASGHFYLNAGVMFDALCKLRGKAPPQVPKYDDCQFMARLEAIDPSLPQFYSVEAGTDLEALAARVGEAVERAYVLPLNAVASIEDFAATGWVGVIPWGFPALYSYATGDVEGARRLVQREADAFADRGLSFDSVAAGYGLRFAAQG
jgi:hypothetical protein